MHIAVYGSICQDEALPFIDAYLRRLRGLCAERGIEVEYFTQTDFGRYLARTGFDSAIKMEEIPADADAVLSFGGDGTFLRAVEWSRYLPVSIYGVNTGHLGYLAGFSIHEPLTALETMLADNHPHGRMMLELECGLRPDHIPAHALNEISVSKGDTTKVVNVRACVDGEFLADYEADGLVVSTPTGSTAYNLSAGGPILEPTLQSVVISPVAPHSLTMRPLVIDADHELTLEVSSRGSECNIAVDGRAFAVPANGTPLCLRRSPHKAFVAMPNGLTFASRLRSKLNWGI